MRFGIIAAMQEEYNAFAKLITVTKETEKYDINIAEAKSAEADIILSKCGIGKVNSARVTQYLIDNYNLDCIISIGSAGALSPDLNYGDVVVSSDSVQFDFDLTIFDRELGHIPDSGRVFESDSFLLEKARALNPKSVGLILTADSFINSPEQKLKLYKDFNALCDDMETGAIAQVCHHAKLPFISVRSISDKPKDETELDFYKYLDLASDNSASFAQKLIMEVQKCNE